jgi:hypothetical protein
MNTTSSSTGSPGFPYQGSISSISDFEAVVEKRRWELGEKFGFMATPSLYFRGQCNSGFKLSAKFNRDYQWAGKSLTDLGKVEQALTEDFENRLKETGLIKHISQLSSNEKGYSGLWERIGQYQHAGLATRFLDWTNSWLVAFFFALHDSTKSHTSQPADLWVLDMTASKIYHEDDLSDITPYDVNEPLHYHATVYMDEDHQTQVGVMNKLHQGGHFFVQAHQQSFIAMEESSDCGQRLQRWLIPAECKEKIMAEVLHKHGIDYDGDVYKGYEILAQKYYLQAGWADEIKKVADEVNKKYLSKIPPRL